MLAKKSLLIIAVTPSSHIYSKLVVRFRLWDFHIEILPVKLPRSHKHMPYVQVVKQIAEQ